MKTTTLMSAFLCAALGACGGAAPQDPATPSAGSAARKPAYTAAPAPARAQPEQDQVPCYLVAGGVGVDLFDDSYALTTNGTGDYIVAWTGDDNQHEFTGQVLVAVGDTVVASDAQGLYDGDQVTQIDPGTIYFDAVTDGNNVQSFTFTTTAEPVRINFYVDGIPAAYQLIFATPDGMGGSYEATTDTIPFDLATSQAGCGGASGMVHKAPPASLSGKRVIRHLATPVASSPRQ